MKALILLRNEHSLWTRKYFKGINPYLVKFVNKPLLEYYFDFCKENGIDEVRVLLENSDMAIEQYSEGGEQWGISLDYSFVNEDDSYKKILLKNKKFIQESDVLVFSGYFFLFHNKNFSMPSHSSVISNGNSFMVKINNNDIKGITNQWYPHDLPVISLEYSLLEEIKSIKEYYSRVMTLITNESEHYNLPGFGTDKGAFIGYNVELPKQCTVEAPVMIGNNVSCKRNVVISNSIIGDNVIVDNDTVLEKSIVYDGTYIGAGLEIKDKIIIRNCIISPDDGEIIEIDDNFLTSGIERNMVRRFFDKVMNSMAAFCGVIIGFIPYYFLTLLLTVTNIIKKRTETILINSQGDCLPVDMYEEQRPSLLLRLFNKLSLDKYPLLLDVIKGKLYIAGNSLLQNNVKNRTLLGELYIYRPALFSYEEAFGETFDDDNTRRMNEMYYSSHVSFMMNIKIAVTTLLKRFLQ